MARFNGNDFDNYGNNGSTNYFSLKDDKDVAQVRFLYNGIDDITGIAVHEIEVNGNKRYISCLRSFNEPVENCPLCQQNYKVSAKLYIPLLVYPQGGQPQVQLWERGKAMYNKLSSLAARYQPLCGTVFEIERNGRKGDTGTKYEIYPIETDGKHVEDVINPEEITDPLGTAVLDKSYEEIIQYLNTGNFDQPQQQSYRPRGQQPYQQPVQQPYQQPASSFGNGGNNGSQQFYQRPDSNFGDGGNIVTQQSATNNGFGGNRSRFSARNSGSNNNGDNVF